MSNATLDADAKALQAYLEPKLKCYVRVGWMRDEEIGPFFIVFADIQEDPKGIIPKKWAGLPVTAQASKPLGQR